ncbi:MAG TPA: amidohydrolase family protein [Dehalococcoidia bacterium]|nr:amidohydrolase family protein [Dehalococcoidia bacterium]
MPTRYTDDPIRVIDMDSHYTEPPDLWTGRAPAAFKDRVPKVVTNDDGSQHWVVDGNVPFGPLGFTVVKKDGDKVQGVLSLTRFEDLSRAAYDVPERLKFLDEHGIYAQIMFPNVAGFGSQKFIQIADNDLRKLCAVIYNDRMADIQKQSGGRLYPQALVPFWNIDDAVAEITRARHDLGLTGIVMCDTPQAFGLPSLDAPQWDRFWSTCEDLDLAVNFHIGAGTTAAFSQPWSTISTPTRIAIGSVALFLDNSRALSNMIFSGVLHRHPKLKVISVESGIGWIPFLLEAMDYEFDEVVPIEEKRALWGDLRPRDIFRRNCYVSFWFENWAPRNAIEEIGADNVMFETDFPHPTCLYPKVKEQVAAVLGSLSPELRKKVLHDTAARVYNLPV